MQSHLHFVCSSTTTGTFSLSGIFTFPVYCVLVILKKSENFNSKIRYFWNLFKILTTNVLISVSMGWHSNNLCVQQPPHCFILRKNKMETQLDKSKINLLSNHTWCKKEKKVQKDHLVRLQVSTVPLTIVACILLVAALKQRFFLEPWRQYTGLQEIEC